MNKADAIIIGAGIIGAATALGLARKNKSVICLDKLPAAGYGSTSGSCAIIRPYYSTVDGSALAYESHFYWQDWADFLGVEDERGLADYNDCGCIVLKTSQNEELQNVSTIMDEIGAPYQHLSVEEVLEKLPFMCLDSFAPAKTTDDPEFGKANPDPLSGGVFFPSGGYISDPQLATHNLQRAGEALGVKYLFNAEVKTIEQRDGRVAGVNLGDGQKISAPVVINVAGPHSHKINELAGVEKQMKIKTRALRHEVSHVPCPPGFDIENKGSVFSDSDIATYLRPEQGNYLLLGSEDPACDEKQWVDPDDFNPHFTEQWRTQVMRMAQRIPDLTIPNQAKGVVELYDVSDDWIPIYDRSDLPGYYMAIGTSGNQFKNAPIVGEMMAELVEACEAGFDHDKTPLTFKLRHIDREVSIGFYSRLRKINQSSSFSVLG
jgi:sarcosine oxidase subunit beta